MDCERGVNYIFVESFTFMRKTRTFPPYWVHLLFIPIGNKRARKGSKNLCSPVMEINECQSAQITPQRCVEK